LILGSSGAGKSTLARELGRRWALPVWHLDRMTWLPGWVLRDRAEADGEFYAHLQESAWVLDGAFPRHVAAAVEAADTVLFLDFPRSLCVARVAWRIVSRYGQVLPDMADGCPERGDFAFLRWIWGWKHTHRPAFVQATQGKAHARVFHRPRELARWLKSEG
jgi:adenylate kinase family enzyme